MTFSQPCQGTATDQQYRSVCRVLGDETPSPLNYEKASEILSAIAYARAIRETIERDGNTCQKNLRQITQFIRLNLSIHSYAIKWSRGRFSRGTHNGPSPLRRNEHFDKVYGFACNPLTLGTGPDICPD